MYYKIGALAKQFGITTQALRFYERHGLLLPTRKSEGGDRRYQSRNLKWLYSIRKYHDLGYSMEETLALFSCESIEELEAMAAEKEAELQRELALLERRLEAVRRQREDLAHILRQLDKCEIVEMPRLWLLINQKGQEVDQSAALQREVQDWMQFLPWVYAASVIDGGLLGMPKNWELREHGFCVEEETAEKLGMSPGPHTEMIGGQRAIHLITGLSRTCDTVEELLDRGLTYAREQGLTVTSAVGRSLAKTKEVLCREDLRPLTIYFEYWLIIEE